MGHLRVIKSAKALISIAFTTVMLFVSSTLTASEPKPYVVAFYNVENFFDTEDTPKHSDKDFTPKGKMRWNDEKYQQKVENTARVLSNLAMQAGDFPIVISLCEVETRGVVEDIAASESLLNASYSVLHYDSPDKRGVDVAMLYRPDILNIEGSCAVKAVVDGQSKLKTRDILTAWGDLEGEPIFLAAVHWTSRYGGEKKTHKHREAHAKQLRAIVDSVYTANPLTKIILMGDFNDNPTDDNMCNVLGAKGDLDSLAAGGLFNPFERAIRAGYGTSVYARQWHLLDNIIVSENLVNADSTTSLKLSKPSFDERLWCVVFQPEYLFETQGVFRGYPKRSFSGKKYQADGYSDHLPIYILLTGKELF